MWCPGCAALFRRVESKIQLMWFKLRYTNKEDMDFGSETRNRYVYVKLGTALCKSVETKF